MTNDTAKIPAYRIGTWQFFRPGGVAVFLTVLLVGLCLGLGIWQVQRLQWKEARIAELELAKTEAPLTAKDLSTDEKQLEALNFRKIRLTGVFMDDREFHLIGRYHEGALGYDVLVPFLVRDEARDEAQKFPLVLLVNRGWIPLDKKDPATRPEPLSATNGEVTIDGLLLLPRAGNPFLPDHDIKGNVWFSYDIARMNKEAELNMLPVLIEAVEANHPQSILPYPRPDYEITIRNDHFYYAVTWFSLAFAGSFIFLLAHRIKREETVA